MSIFKSKLLDCISRDGIAKQQLKRKEMVDSSLPLLPIPICPILSKQHNPMTRPHMSYSPVYVFPLATF